MYSCEMFKDQCIVRTHHPPIQAYVHTSLCNFDMTFMVNRTHTDEEKTRSLTYLDERNVTEDNVYLRIPWEKKTEIATNVCTSCNFYCRIYERLFK